MKIITRTRDHRESYTSKYLKEAEDFVGEAHFNDEIGIDDQYTIFYYTSDVPEVIVDWVVDNRYMIWHLLEDGIEFNSLSELVGKINAAGIEWDEDSWELLWDNE
jgi:hypothetical protein